MKNENHICTKCEYELPKYREHHDTNNHVSQLFWGRVMMEQATAYLQYRKDSSVQKIIYKIKYKGEIKLGIEMGRQFGMELLNTDFNSIDAIVPVPLHPAKQRKRGFNQSEIIALGISQILHKPVVTDFLIRTANTSTQTKKSRFDRWMNVEKIFAIKNAEQLKNKHILLIDDVVTTGATIEACAAELIQIEGTTVSLAALAVAVNH